MANTLGALGSAANDACTLCKRTWWAFLIGGLASIVFGVLALTTPGVALAVLAMFFAAWVLVDGAFNALGALQHRGKDGWWLMLLIGLLGIGVGLPPGASTPTSSSSISTASNPKARCRTCW